MSTPYDDEPITPTDAGAALCSTCGQPLFFLGHDDAFDEEAIARAEAEGGFCPTCGQRLLDPAV